MAMTERIDVTRRAQIEAHVEACRDQVMTGAVELGRWLCRAKDENIVPHGEWEEWLRIHAGVSERSAQRLMQVAREIPEGSPLERLGIAKLDALLALPAGEREAAAADMGAESLSSREVRREVSQRMHPDAPASDGAAWTGREKLSAAEALKVAKAAKEEANEYRRTVSRQTTELRQARDRQEELESALRASREELSAARGELALQKARQPEVVEKVPDDYVDLRQRLAKAEADADRLADQLDQMKAMRLESEMGGEPEVSSRIISLIGGFMTQAAALPQRIRDAGNCVDDRDINLILGQTQAIRTWCDAIRDALLDQPRLAGR